MSDEKEKMEIPASGNLGLLALGYRGVQLWREARDRQMQKANEEKDVKDS